MFPNPQSNSSLSTTIDISCSSTPRTFNQANISLADFISLTNSNATQEEFKQGAVGHMFQSNKATKFSARPPQGLDPLQRMLLQQALMNQSAGMEMQARIGGADSDSSEENYYYMDDDNDSDGSDSMPNLVSSEPQSFNLRGHPLALPNQVITQQRVIQTPLFRWEQDEDTVTIYTQPPFFLIPQHQVVSQQILDLKPGQKLPEIRVKITSDHLNVGVENRHPVLNQDLTYDVKPADSYHYYTEDELIIVLAKKKETLYWPTPFQTMPKFIENNWLSTKSQLKKQERRQERRQKKPNIPKMPKVITLNTQNAPQTKFNTFMKQDTDFELAIEYINGDKAYSQRFNIRDQLFKLKNTFDSFLNLQINTNSFRVEFNRAAPDFDEAYAKFNDLQPRKEKIFCPIKIQGSRQEKKFKIQQCLNNLKLSSYISVEEDDEDLYVELQAPEGQYDKLMEDKSKVENALLSSLKQRIILFNETMTSDSLDIYCFYLYLKKFKVIEDLFKENGIHQSVSYSEDIFQISADLPYLKQDSITDELKEIVDSLVVRCESVACDQNIFDHSRKLSKKFEDKFKVLVYPAITRKVSYEVKKRKRNRTKKEVVRFEVAFPQKAKGPQTVQLELNLVGDEENVEACWQELKEYVQSLAWVAKELELHKKVYKWIDIGEISIQKIEKLYKVQISQQNSQVVWIKGKHKEQRVEKTISALEDLSEELKKQDEEALQKKFQQTYETIKLPNAPNKELYTQLSKNVDRLEYISKDFEVNVTFDSEGVMFAGQPEDIAKAKEKVMALIKEITQSYTKIVISDPLKVQAIEKLGYQILEKQYQVKITQRPLDKFGSNTFFATNPKEQTNQRQNRFFTPNTNVNYQWAYKVYPQDPNYSQRTDKMFDFFDFDTDQNDQIENFYKWCCVTNNFGQKREIVGDQAKSKNGFKYEIIGSSQDSNSWTETNMQTGKVRQLRRVELAGISRNTSVATSKRECSISVMSRQLESIFNMGFEETKEEDDQISQYEIEGYKSNVSDLQVELDSFSKNSENYKEFISISHEFIIQHKILLDELSVILKREFNCSMKVIDKSIEIQGFKAKMGKDRLEVVIENVKRLLLPETWLANLKFYTTTEKTVIIQVQAGPEFDEVKNNFYKTMPLSTKIVKVERLQNKKIWKTYQTEYENLTKGTQEPKEFWLYHGTRETDPSSVYNSSEGFDMRFSNSGMWGQAIYFAANASYSHNYAYKLGQQFVSGELKKVNQMFYARVMVGKFIELPSDSSLKLPPLKGNSTSKRYDSVKGTTNGSDVYMIYVNKKAYPEYLITYA